MDYLTEKAITQLQFQGYGYRRIANLLNLPVETVKSHCKRHPLTPAKAEKLSLCLQCGADVGQKPHRKKKRFCSDKCRSAWWNAHPADSPGKTAAVCQFCGKEFPSYPVKNRKFCSRACYFKSKGGGGYER